MRCDRTIDRHLPLPLSLSVVSIYEVTNEAIMMSPFGLWTVCEFVSVAITVLCPWSQVTIFGQEGGAFIDSMMCSRYQEATVIQEDHALDYSTSTMCPFNTGAGTYMLNMWPQCKVKTKYAKNEGADFFKKKIILLTVENNETAPYRQMDRKSPSID